MMVSTVTKSSLSLTTCHQDNPPILHLFSPTKLIHDLSYVDKTYYGSVHTLFTRSASRNATTKSLESLDPSLHSAIFRRAVNLLASMSCLDLRGLDLCMVPLQICQLSHLTSLDLSHNSLTTLPPTMKHLKHLRHLNLSHNKLTQLPNVISHLGKLTTLNISHNTCLSSLPASLNEAVQLTTLDISHTNVASLPAELACLINIRTEHCLRLTNNTSHISYTLNHDPPSLLEICARKLMTLACYRTALVIYLHRQQKDQQDLQQQRSQNQLSSYYDSRVIAVWKSAIKKRLKRTTLPIASKKQLSQASFLPLLSASTSKSVKLSTSIGLASDNNYISMLVNLPSHLWDYMLKAQPCSYCGKPYIQNYVTRYRIVQRLDESLLPIHYRLCRAHWSDESDRLLSLFSGVV